MRQSPRGDERDRADLRAVGQTAALELLGKEAAVEILQPRQQDLRLIPAVKGCAGQMVDFCRTEPKAQHIVEIEVVQLIRTDEFFGLLGNRAV